MADRLRSGRASAVEIPVPDGDQRIHALLADPAGYFDQARAAAYEQAADELDAEWAKNKS